MFFRAYSLQDFRLTPFFDIEVVQKCLTGRDEALFDSADILAQLHIVDNQMAYYILPFFGQYGFSDILKMTRFCELTLNNIVAAKMNRAKMKNRTSR